MLMSSGQLQTQRAAEIPMASHCQLHVQLQRFTILKVYRASVQKNQEVLSMGDSSAGLVVHKSI